MNNWSLSILKSQIVKTMKRSYDHRQKGEFAHLKLDLQSWPLVSAVSSFLVVSGFLEFKFNLSITVFLSS